MQVLFLTSNSDSLSLANWLRERVYVKVRTEAIDVAALDHDKPDLVVSYNYGHIIRKNVLSALPGRFLNLHISLLPFNRGADPNVWSILDATPKGVSIHLIDEGLDTGEIVAQCESEFDESLHTLTSSYKFLHEEIQGLFKQTWPGIASATGSMASIPQDGTGTAHRKREFEEIRDHLLGREGWEVPIPVLRSRYAALNALSVLEN